MKTSTCLSAALGYADAGYPVLILYPIIDGKCACPDKYKLAGKCKPGKHPIGELCPKAHQSATTDKATIATWWTLHPDGNVGIALGPAGLVDVAPDSTEWWTRFVGLGLPRTMHFRSGGGEGHEHWLYLRGDMPAVRNAQRGRYDVLSDGYCVAPPSMHESGRRYEWVDRVLPVEAPEWIEDFQAAYLTERESVNDEPLEAWDDDLPFDLDAQQQQVWLGVGAAADRSQGLIDIGRMVWDAGLHDLEAVASILKERDEALGWHKYSTRRNAAFRYREAAQRSVPPIRVKLFRNSAYRGGNSGTARDAVSNPLKGVSGLKWHSVPDVMAMAAEQVEWLIQDWLSKGLMTELVAKVKMGKTTFALEGLRAAIAGDESYCGKAILRPIRVGYVTEEGVGTFQQNLVRYGLSDLGESDGFYTVFDFETPVGVDLPQIVNDLIEQGQERGVDVIVLDTLSVVAGLDEEDHSGKAAGVMHEIRRLANAGFAVLILRHSRKSGGDVGDAGRGSSAISGYCDLLLQIEPFKGDEDTTNLRILRCRSRMSASIEPLTLELDKQTERYKLIGAVQSREERLQGVILQALRDLGATNEANGKTSAEVTVKSGKQKAAVTENLKVMVVSGDVKSAKHGQAIVYWLPLQVHITHEAEAVPPVPPVPPVPAGSGIPEQVQEQPPLRGVEENLAVPGFSPPLFRGGNSGTARTAKAKTPEAVAKLAEAKAARELARLEAADLAAPTLEYLTVLDMVELSEAVSLLSTAACSLDTETTGLDAHRDKLRTINLSDGATHVVIDVWAVAHNSPTNDPWSALQGYLDEVGSVRMHTYLFDLAFLAQVGLSVEPSKILDVKTMAMVLESEEAHVDYRLQGIAKRHLHEHVAKTEQKRGWDVPPGSLRHAKLAYAAEDARVTYAAAVALEDALFADPDADSLVSCLNLERNVQAATWWLASAGVPCDVGILKRAIAEQEALVDDRLQELNGIAGVGVNVNWRSPSQVLPILQERGLELVSTGIDALMEAQSDDPIIDALLGYRSAGTCMGLLRKTLSSVAPDGRIYASFNPIGAQTGRTSCADPNLQQLPHETLARKSIRPGPGRAFVRADYSQLQLVIAAWLSEDRTMRQILNTPGGDIHSATAAAVGCTRQEAKAINFGFLFGAGADTFRREQRKNGIVLSEDEAKRQRSLFFKTYPGIRAWHRGLGAWGDEAEVIDFSGSGRRRRRIFSNNVKANTPVQMVEAHGFKLAMTRLYDTRSSVPSARLVMMVHDELIAECDQGDVALCKQWLKSNMEAAMQPLVEGVVVHCDPEEVASYADEDKH